MKKKKIYSTLSLVLTFMVISKFNIAYANTNTLPIKPPIKANITTNNISFTTVSQDDMKNISPKAESIINSLKQERGFYIFDSKTYDIKDGYTYVMISCGERSSSGYGIEALSIEDIEGITKITVEETYPSPKYSYLTVMTYPYTIVKFKGATQNIVVTSKKDKKFDNLSSNNDSTEITDKNWTDITKTEKVATNKIWKITFNKPINDLIVDNGYVYVKDSKGNKFSTSILLIDNKTIKIKPSTNYLPGETYYIFINTKDYQNKNNKNLNNGYRVKFTVNK